MPARFGRLRGIQDINMTFVFEPAPIVNDGERIRGITATAISRPFLQWGH